MMGKQAARKQYNNLNCRFPSFNKASDLYETIRDITKPGGDYTVRNFVGVIQKMSPVEEATVETPLFPKGALEYYTKKNLGYHVTDREIEEWQLEERGGEQGNYAQGMQKKLTNVINCLKEFPHSKRAIITIPFSEEGSQYADYKDPGQTKCVRELHFYIEDNKLKCTGILRMQNANIFPKNIHFIATVMGLVADNLGVKVGEYTHWITNLCHDRTAQHC